MPALIEACRARTLALPALQDLTQDDFGHPRGLDAGAVDRRLDRDFAEIVSRHGRESPIECADRRAHRADNHNVVFHGRILSIGVLKTGVCRWLAHISHKEARAARQDATARHCRYADRTPLLLSSSGRGKPGITKR